jgi:hypothetical protein
MRGLISRSDARRDSSVGFGSATVPVALAGVSPASRAMRQPARKGERPQPETVFGGTPKTAVETTALPKATTWRNCVPHSKTLRVQRVPPIYRKVLECALASVAGPRALAVLS